MQLCNRYQYHYSVGNTVTTCHGEDCYVLYVHARQRFCIVCFAFFCQSTSHAHTFTCWPPRPMHIFSSIDYTGGELWRVRDRHGKDMLLGPTHEVMVMVVVIMIVDSSWDECARMRVRRCDLFPIRHPRGACRKPSPLWWPVRCTRTGTCRSHSIR